MAKSYGILLAMLYVILFISTVLAMEWVSWFLHKYVMHGFLWILHEDHHVIRKERKWQKNDFFAFFFAVPSFLFILIGTQWGPLWLGIIGFGIMAYGFLYFFVHEVVIHRRWTIIPILSNWYFDAIIKAHRHHHQIRTKEGCSNFGMLIVPLKYFLRDDVPSPLTKRTI